jgi:F0F1-type ATP synthase membrane subunit b/b'
MSDKEARSPKQIRNDIDQTREELGETVAAVADKADVKKQTKTKVQELGDKAKQAAPDSAGEGVQQAQQFAQTNPVPLAIGGAFLAGFILGRILSR